MKHINTLNAAARVRFLRGLLTASLLSPAMLMIKRHLKRAERQIDRAYRSLRRTSAWPYCGRRQQLRYGHQRADERQRNSHKPGTVQPRHIFGAPRAA
jgi:hypothetical protein